MKHRRQKKGDDQSSSNRIWITHNPIGMPSLAFYTGITPERYQHVEPNAQHPPKDGSKTPPLACMRANRTRCMMGVDNIQLQGSILLHFLSHQAMTIFSRTPGYTVSSLIPLRILHRSPAQPFAYLAHLISRHRAGNKKTRMKLAE